MQDATATAASEASHASQEGRFEFEPRAERFNHNVFRYPAKFHPPVAHSLISKFSNEGDVILDPFVGSGTALVEAALLGRSAVGSDIDPLAAFVARAKVSPFDLTRLRMEVCELVERLQQRREADEIRFGSFQKDVSPEDYVATVGHVGHLIPAIPNLHHWFRRRVCLQLAAIKSDIHEIATDSQQRQFHALCFGSIIRNSSNADPVPVSGLEVTSHMLAKERQGRSVDPYMLMVQSLRKTLKATEEFLGASRSDLGRFDVRVADASTLNFLPPKSIDAVVTSPPYLTAVDYYRRHQLEMYWLDLVDDAADRLRLLPSYIGRHGVSMAQMEAYKDMPARSRIGRRWMAYLKETKPARARALHHYSASMTRVLDRLLEVVKIGGKVVMVVGDSQVNCRIGIPVTANVIVGENGAGKTHILKLIYSILATSWEEGRKSAITPTKATLQRALAEKLVNVFRPESLGRLARRRQGRERCDVVARFNNRDLNIWLRLCNAKQIGSCNRTDAS